MKEIEQNKYIANEINALIDWSNQHAVCNGTTYDE